jgi:hypothetical protein
MEKCSSICISVTITLPLLYFRFNYVTVFSGISVTITVSVNVFDLFPLMDISVTVNGKNTAHRAVWEVNGADCTVF